MYGPPGKNLYHGCDVRRQCLESFAGGDMESSVSLIEESRSRRQGLSLQVDVWVMLYGIVLGVAVIHGGTENANAAAWVTTNEIPSII
jgi:hypothetical protein